MAPPQWGMHLQRAAAHMQHCDLRSYHGVDMMTRCHSIPANEMPRHLYLTVAASPAGRQYHCAMVSATMYSLSCNVQEKKQGFDP
jgi:hypothetical protein